MKSFSRLTPFNIRRLAVDRLALCVLTLLASPGCDTGLKTYPASGTVRFTDGNPLAGGAIIFHSVELGVQARAKISDNGSFRLGTEDATDGAVAGLHRVTVRAAWESPETPPKFPVKRKYHRPETSGLEYEVIPKGSNHFEITVEPR